MYLFMKVGFLLPNNHKDLDLSYDFEIVFEGKAIIIMTAKIQYSFKMW